MHATTRRIATRLAAAHRLLLVLPAGQVGAILWLIWTRTPHVPYWDEWELVSFLDLADQGRLQLGTFWEFQNEHRILIPRLLLYALIGLTGWNRQLIMTVNLAIAGAAVALVLGSIRRALGPTGFAVLFVPCSLLLLSFAHFENWLLPFQATFIWTLGGVACCLWALTPALPDRAWRAGRFWLAVLGASVAALSALNGLLAWPAFAPAVWRGGRGARLAWGLSALAITTPYFIGFPHGVSGGVPPLAYADYALVYLGSPLAASSLGHTSVVLARLAGLAGLVLPGALLLTHGRPGEDAGRSVAWIGLALFALGTALLSALGRAQYGIEQALTPRYRLFSMLWWVALLVLTWLVGARRRRRAGARRPRDPVRRWEAVIGLGVGLPLVLGAARADLGGFGDGLRWHAGLRQREGCVVDYPAASDACLLLFYPLAPHARVKAAYLEEHRLAAFRGAALPDLTRLPRTGAVLAVIDAVNGVNPQESPIVAAPEAPLVIRGWAVDAAARAPASVVYVTVDDQYTYRAAYGENRPDVAAATHVPAYQGSGFTARLPSCMLDPGPLLAIAIVAHDARASGTGSQHVTVVVRDITPAAQSGGRCRPAALVRPRGDRAALAASA